MRAAPTATDEILFTQDAAGIAQLQEACAGTPLVTVPRFELDVHDVSALWRTGTHLLGEAPLR